MLLFSLAYDMKAIFKLNNTPSKIKRPADARQIGISWPNQEYFKLLPITWAYRGGVHIMWCINEGSVYLVNVMNFMCVQGENKFLRRTIKTCRVAFRNTI